MAGKLIHRYSAVAEYAELLSTKASRRRERRRSSHSRTHPMVLAASATSTPSDWYESLMPPLEDFKAVIRRIQSSGNVSQSSVFQALIPLVVFGVLLIVGARVLQPHSFAHHVLAAPWENRADLFRGLLVVLCALGIGIAGLRTLIWGTAVCVDMLLDSTKPMAIADCISDAQDAPASSSSLVSGIFQ